MSNVGNKFNLNCISNLNIYNKNVFNNPGENENFFELDKNKNDISIDYRLLEKNTQVSFTQLQSAKETALDQKNSLQSCNNPNFDDLDYTFSKLNNKIHRDNTENVFRDKKLKFLRAINLIFKKHCSVFKINHLYINKYDQLKNSKINIDEMSLLQPNSIEGVSSYFGIPYPKNKKFNNSNLPVNLSMNSYSNEKSLLGRKRIIISNENLIVPQLEIDKIEFPSILNNQNYIQYSKPDTLDDYFSEPSGKPKKNFGKVNNKKRKIDSELLKTEDLYANTLKNSIEDSLLNSIQTDSSKLINTEKNNSPSESLYDKYTSTSVPSYPDNPSHKIHVNMNITNININQKNQHVYKNIRQPIKCDRDARLILELKEVLRKRNIKFSELHYSNSYILNFKISFDNNPKNYQLTIDSETSKILNYKKLKENEIIITVNNYEESAANIIVTELCNLKKELENCIKNY